jgi:iron complex transport system substrate-binding protein
MTVIAGGKDIVENLDKECGHRITVDAEWILEQNPDIYFIQDYSRDTGYGTDDPSEMAAAREEVFMNIPVLAEVNAVKSRDGYMLCRNFRNGGDGNILGTAYMAKWLHSDLFEDLDPRAIHQEYVDRFCGIDYDVREHGVFVYPPLED